MSTESAPESVEHAAEGAVVPEDEEAHPVSVLELFFDLVFVVRSRR